MVTKGVVIKDTGVKGVREQSENARVKGVERKCTRRGDTGI